MAIVSVRERTWGRAGSASGELSAGKINSLDKSYEREFVVTTDSLDDGSRIVRLAPGIPRLFTRYAAGSDLDLSCYASSIDVSPLGGTGYHWTVKVQYRWQPNPEAETSDNPLEQPPEISWDSVVVQVGVLKARIVPAAGIPKNDVPVTNSAGQGFDPPVERDVAHLQLTYSRNELSFSPVLASAYFSAVNKSTWLGVPKHVARCMGISATKQYHTDDEGGISFGYWKVTYVFEFKPYNSETNKWETWDREFLDQGTMQKNAAGDGLEVIRDKQQHAVTEPVPLDGFGKQLAQDKVDMFEFKYRKYEIEPEADFGPLNIILT